jgi:hypothetical protein
MPEGDTIRRLANKIQAPFAGQRCLKTVTRDPRLVGVDRTAPRCSRLTLSANTSWKRVSTWWTSQPLDQARTVEPFELANCWPFIPPAEAPPIRADSHVSRSLGDGCTAAGKASWPGLPCVRRSSFIWRS